MLHFLSYFGSKLRKFCLGAWEIFNKTLFFLFRTESASYIYRLFLVNKEARNLLTLVDIDDLLPNNELVHQLIVDLIVLALFNSKQSILKVHNRTLHTE